MSEGKAAYGQEPLDPAIVAVIASALFAPLVFVSGALLFFILKAFRANAFPAFAIAALSAITGMMVHQGLIAWITGPVFSFSGIYLSALPESLISFLFNPGELAAISAAATKWLASPGVWISCAPAGAFCGAGAYGVGKLKFQNPLGSLKRDKPMERLHGKVGDLPARLVNRKRADTKAGSLIGTDRHARIIELTDRAANQHTLVLGTTGSGKTVTICNIVESAINRAIPLIYIDGKGDYDLACRIARFGKQQERQVSLFAMNGESLSYNPLSAGGFTSRKDRIIELRDWSEEHYKKLAEGYLQSVFKVMDACGIPCNLTSLSSHLDLKRLKSLVRENERNIPDAQALMDELNSQDEAAKNIESLIAEIRNFTASEIGPLFKIEEGKPVLTLQNIIRENGIAYFCLPALEFPSMSQTLGKLIINDLKATMAQQLAGGERKKVYVIFDEFSVFAGEQVLNVINMGRSAGIHAVLSTQSLSDIAAGRRDNADHFINQVVGNCNNFILHRQNSPEDAEKLAAMMGTRSTLEYTAQLSQSGPTHMGTVRRTRGFIAHPDEIKTLKTGEAFFFSKEDNKISRIRVRKSRI